MSIRLKLLLGCFLLTFGTMTVGFFSQSAQRQIGDLAMQIYDDALVSTNAMRSAQNGLFRVVAFVESASARNEIVNTQPLDADQARFISTRLVSVLADLNIAAEGALSPEGYQAVSALRNRITTLRSTGGRISGRMLNNELALADAEVDAAVRVFGNDAFKVRHDVGELIATSVQRTWLAMGIAGVIAALISVLLARSIIPAIRHAMQIARSIANGNFDNQIVASGGLEAAELLRALSHMQESLSRHIGRFEKHAASQANDYDGQIATQNARFDAALGNMKHGLCMFDAAGKLVVYNRRFAALFGELAIGTTFSSMLANEAFSDMLHPSRDEVSRYETRDNRLIEVSRQAVAGGGQVFSFDDITDPRDASMRLSHLATHDALTQIPNRISLVQRLKDILAGDNGLEEVAFLSIDLDGFKFVNDTLGHGVGDELLKAAALRIREAVGENDFVARIGGDEFAVIQTARPQPRASEDLSRRLIDSLSTLFEIDGHTVSIGASAGIVAAADMAGRALVDCEVVMKRADLALQAARARGRNSYLFFQNEMDEEIQRRRRIEIDLIEALARGELLLHYQPFVNVARGEVTGFEVLLRWQHPKRGMVSPAEFVPIAEESTLICEIGLWVLETACREALRWPATLSVSVNLSPVQFRSKTLLADVENILSMTGFPPSRLQLEVTESVMLQDTEAVLEVLNGFRRLGIRISMDDFGTGYSSLGYLSRFPFDKVKIDQSFVREINRRENLAVVRAVIGLSHAMGISVIAEGVETRAQRDTLLKESCEEMQGYHFSRPRPADELPTFLREFSRARVRAAPKTIEGESVTVPETAALLPEPATV